MAQRASLDGDVNMDLRPRRQLEIVKPRLQMGCLILPLAARVFMIALGVLTDFHVGEFTHHQWALSFAQPLTVYVGIAAKTLQL